MCERQFPLKWIGFIQFLQNSAAYIVTEITHKYNNFVLLFSAIGILEVMLGIAMIVVQNIATNKEAALGHIYAGVWGWNLCKCI